MSPEVRVFPDRIALGEAAASFIAEIVRARGSAGRTCSIVLAGGSTPQQTYALLREQADLSWSHVHFFMGDERFVPESHAESNQGMARRELGAILASAGGNAHFIDTGVPDPKTAADAYEGVIREYLSRHGTFDVLLLGMGADGHTLSLFPDAPPLDESRFVITVKAPPSYLTRERITLTPLAANRSDTALFLVAGDDKRDAFDAIHSEAKELPAALIKPRERLLWFVDRGVTDGN